MLQVATNLREHFASISNVESYLYEWYFHFMLQLNEVYQVGGDSLGMWEEHGQTFYEVRIKYINFKSIKLESSTSQRQPKVAYKIDSRVGGNLMPSKIFNVYLQRQQKNCCMQQKQLSNSKTIQFNHRTIRCLFSLITTQR